ncbi:hypothetical protein HPB50_023309 [Hyalomma asiaticum]|uniref:Uncharacterized protein n=1 Tax=Hyalomma asiaticum TaxID=266040 RepID=A0ACB7TQ22_HYAAI|nr:hypothetical protein HPB50_023309 [Hyalomma asiaticum]
MADQSKVRLSGGVSSEPAASTITVSRKASMSYNTGKVAGGSFLRDEISVFIAVRSCKIVPNSFSALSSEPHAQPVEADKKQEMVAAPAAVRSLFEGASARIQAPSAHLSC